MDKLKLSKTENEMLVNALHDYEYENSCECEAIGNALLNKLDKVLNIDGEIDG